jgi:branched-chain amino acid transport system substrate-binding protein
VTTTSRYRLIGSAVLVTAAATLIAACSSSSDNSGGSSSGASSEGGGPTSPAPTGSVIKIGIISSLSGSQASSSNQAGTVGPAWAAWVNANGGINGHSVQVISEDDGGDPAKAQAAEKKLVDQDQVLAILVGSDNLVTAYQADAISKGVALVSGTANSSGWYQKVGMFPTPTDVLSGLSDQLLVAQQFGHAKKFANLYCSEVAACAEGTHLQTPLAAKIGLGYTSLAVSSTATSYTAQCLQLQQQDVDYAQLNFTTAAAAKFVEDCQAQNYNPTWGSSEQAIGKDLLDVPDITLYGPAYAFPSVAENPVVATFRDAMGKYAKDDNWKEGTASFAWSGLEVLRKALAGVGPSPSRKDVTAALNTIKNEDLGGLLPNKITFTAGKPTAFGSHPCSFVVGIKDGKTTAPNGLRPVCPSA